MQDSKLGALRTKIDKRKSLVSRRYRARFSAIQQDVPTSHTSTSALGRKRRLKYLSFQRMQVARRRSLMFRFAPEDESRIVAIENTASNAILNTPSKQDTQVVNGIKSPGGSVMTPGGKDKMEEDACCEGGTPRGSKNTVTTYTFSQKDCELKPIEVPKYLHQQPTRIVIDSFTVTKEDLKLGRNKLRKSAKAIVGESAGHYARRHGFEDPAFNKGEKKSTYEHLHDRAKEFNGSDVKSNFIVATSACNSAMMRAEADVRDLLKKPDIHEVRVTTKKEFIGDTRIIKKIEYTIEWNNGHFKKHKISGLRTKKPIYETFYYSNKPHMQDLEQKKVTVSEILAQQTKNLLTPSSADNDATDNLSPNKSDAALCRKRGFFQEPGKEAKQRRDDGVRRVLFRDHDQITNTPVLVK